MYLVRVQHVHHGQQGTDLHLCLRLLERLASRAFLGRLAVFHEAGRDGPEAEPRLDRAPAEQDAAFVFGHAADDQLGVLVVDDATGLADVAGEVVAFGRAERDRIAAGGAELHGEGVRG